MASTMLTPQVHHGSSGKGGARGENDSSLANGATAADLSTIFTFESAAECGISTNCSTSSSSSGSSGSSGSSSSVLNLVASTPISKPNPNLLTKNTPVAPIASSGTKDYKTPKGACLLNVLKGDLCAVCLSPLFKDDKREDSSDVTGVNLSSSSNSIPGSEDKKGLCETKCKHCFHKKCLDSAKEIKAECPLCRFELTPPEGTCKFLAPAAVRSAITGAASRARNAVRAAMMRRNNANQSSQSESRASFFSSPADNSSGTANPTGEEDSEQIQ